MSNHTNICILGATGAWGKNITQSMLKIDLINLTICDLNKQALDTLQNQYPNIITTSDFNSVLTNPLITAVMIALPAEMHYTFAKKALEANKDVYVEKPMTLDIAEATELVAIAKQKNLILMVGHLLHYHPAIEKIKTIIKSDQIGKIINIVSNRLNLGIFRTTENSLWSLAPHDISIILSLLEL